MKAAVNDLMEEDLAAIAAVMEQHVQARQRLRQVVQTARANGHSWAVIAAVLGVSRQSAWERFRS